MRVFASSLAAFVIVGTGAKAQSTAPQIDFNLLRPPNVVGSYVNGYEQGQRIAAQRAAEQRAEAEAERESQDRAVAGREDQERKWREIDAGSLIAEGHCDQAKANALRAGDLDLAAHVVALCPSSGPAH